MLQRVGGVLTIIMGLAFVGFIPALQRQARFAPRMLSTVAGAPLLGAVFALGWTPCLGPTLTGVITVASATDGASVARGVLLVIAYCLGLGIPFVLLAFGSSWAVGGLGWLRRHTRAIQIFGGVLLILVGIALVTGVWNDFVSWVRDAFVSDVRLPIEHPSCEQMLHSALRARVRNTWRALTSMGTALVLLFLLALAAVPGALLPQRSLNESKVDEYIGQHPVIGPWLDRLQFFEVFSSFWFTAIYVLLFISLVGCLTPRMIEHARSLRAVPVPAPRNLARLPKHAEAQTTGDPQALATDMSQRLRGWRKVVRTDDGHRRTLGREGLPARIRQPGLPLLAAGPAGRGGDRQDVRLRGQRHRHRRRRAGVLLGVPGGVRLVPRRQHRRRHVAVPDVRARQRFPGPLPRQRAGQDVRRPHRLPGG